MDPSDGSVIRNDCLPGILLTTQETITPTDFQTILPNQAFNHDAVNSVTVTASDIFKYGGNTGTSYISQYTHVFRRKIGACTVYYEADDNPRYNSRTRLNYPQAIRYIWPNIRESIRNAFYIARHDPWAARPMLPPEPEEHEILEGITSTPQIVNSTALDRTSVGTHYTYITRSDYKDIHRTRLLPLVKSNELSTNSDFENVYLAKYKRNYYERDLYAKISEPGNDALDALHFVYKYIAKVKQFARNEAAPEEGEIVEVQTPFALPQHMMRGGKAPRSKKPSTRRVKKGGALPLRSIQDFMKTYYTDANIEKEYSALKSATKPAVLEKEETHTGYAVLCKIQFIKNFNFNNQVIKQPVNNSLIQSIEFIPDEKTDCTYVLVHFVDNDASLSGGTKTRRKKMSVSSTPTQNGRKLRNAPAASGKAVRRAT